MRPPRMNAARWVVLVALGVVAIFAADAGWPFLGALVVFVVTVLGWWAWRAARLDARERVRREMEAAPHAPVIEPFQTCPSCAVYGSPLIELCGDGRRWQLKCWECGHQWFDPPTPTQGVVFGN